MPGTPELYAEAEALAAELAWLQEAARLGKVDELSYVAAKRDINERGRELAKKFGPGWRYERGGLIYSAAFLSEERA